MLIIALPKHLEKKKIIVFLRKCQEKAFYEKNNADKKKHFSKVLSFIQKRYFL